jgi:exoribonuclease II
MMPRDVITRWNSTYDMLEFAVDYREALDSITGNQKMKLRQYELDEEDWEIATKLRDILKVNHLFLSKNY